MRIYRRLEVFLLLTATFFLYLNPHLTQNMGKQILKKLIDRKVHYISQFFCFDKKFHHILFLTNQDQMLWTLHIHLCFSLDQCRHI